MPEITSFEEKEIIVDLEVENQTTFQTQKLIGKLDCIIFDSNNKVELIIESEYGYLILQRHELNGIHYLNPRNRTTTPIEDLKDFPGYEEFNLNEKLIITAIGTKNTKVKIIFRFS